MKTKKKYYAGAQKVYVPQKGTDGDVLGGTVSMAAQGAQMGQVAGPYGAAAGAVIGGVGGYLMADSTRRKQNAANEFAKRQNTRTDAMRESEGMGIMQNTSENAGSLYGGMNTQTAHGLYDNQAAIAKHGKKHLKKYEGGAEEIEEMEGPGPKQKKKPKLGEPSYRIKSYIDEQVKPGLKSSKTPMPTDQELINKTQEEMAVYGASPGDTPEMENIGRKVHDFYFPGLSSSNPESEKPHSFYDADPNRLTERKKNRMSLNYDGSSQKVIISDNMRRHPSQDEGTPVRAAKLDPSSKKYDRYVGDVPAGGQVQSKDYYTGTPADLNRMSAENKAGKEPSYIGISSVAKKGHTTRPKTRKAPGSLIGDSDYGGETYMDKDPIGYDGMPTELHNITNSQRSAQLEKAKKEGLYKSPNNIKTRHYPDTSTIPPDGPNLQRKGTKTLKKYPDGEIALKAKRNPTTARDLYGMQNYEPLDRNRKRITDEDGNYETEAKMGFNLDGNEVNLPTVIGGIRYSEDDVIDKFKNGEIGHMGVGKTQEEADRLARRRTFMYNMKRQGTKSLTEMSINDGLSKVDHNTRMFKAHEKSTRPRLRKGLKTKSDVEVEIEGGEPVFRKDAKGKYHPVYYAPNGPTHEQGGIPIRAKEGDAIVTAQKGKGALAMEHYNLGNQGIVKNIIDTMPEDKPKKRYAGGALKVETDPVTNKKDPPTDEKKKKIENSKNLTPAQIKDLELRAKRGKVDPKTKVYSEIEKDGTKIRSKQIGVVENEKKTQRPPEKFATPAEHNATVGYYKKLKETNPDAYWKNVELRGKNLDKGYMFTDDDMARDFQERFNTEVTIEEEEGDETPDPGTTTIPPPTPPPPPPTPAPVTPTPEPVGVGGSIGGGDAIPEETPEETPWPQPKRPMHNLGELAPIGMGIGNWMSGPMEEKLDRYNPKLLDYRFRSQDAVNNAAQNAQLAGAQASRASGGNAASMSANAANARNLQTGQLAGIMDKEATQNADLHNANIGILNDAGKTNVAISHQENDINARNYGKWASAKEKLGTNINVMGGNVARVENDYAERKYLNAINKHQFGLFKEADMRRINLALATSPANFEGADALAKGIGLTREQANASTAMSKRNASIDSAEMRMMYSNISGKTPEQVKAYKDSLTPEQRLRFEKYNNSGFSGMSVGAGESDGGYSGSPQSPNGFPMAKNIADAAPSSTPPTETGIGTGTGIGTVGTQPPPPPTGAENNPTGIGGIGPSPNPGVFKPNNPINPINPGVPGVGSTPPRLGETGFEKSFVPPGAGDMSFEGEKRMPEVGPYNNKKDLRKGRKSLTLRSGVKSEKHATHGDIMDDFDESLEYSTKSSGTKYGKGGAGSYGRSSSVDKLYSVKQNLGRRLGR